MTNQEKILKSIKDIETAIESAALILANIADDEDASIAPTSTSYVAGYIGAALSVIRWAKDAVEFVKDKPDGYERTANAKIS